MTVLSPWLPPEGWTSTRIRSLGVAWGESAPAAATALANTDGTAEPAKTGSSPCLMKSRRLKMVAHLHQFNWDFRLGRSTHSTPGWVFCFGAPNALHPVGRSLVGFAATQRAARRSWGMPADEG